MSTIDASGNKKFSIRKKTDLNDKKKLFPTLILGINAWIQLIFKKKNQYQ